MFWLSEISILVEQQLRVCTVPNVGHTRRGSHAILAPIGQLRNPVTYHVTSATGGYNAWKFNGY